MIEREIEWNNEKNCVIFFHLKMRNLPLSFFVFDFSSESTHSFSLQLHIIVFSIRFFLHCLFSIICLSFHLTAHSVYTKIIMQTLTNSLERTQMDMKIFLSKYPNSPVVSLIYSYERKQTPKTDTFINIRFLD